MKQRISRRGLLAAAALPAIGAGQNPQAAALPSNAEEELAAARAQVRSNAEQIAKVKLTPAVEPATYFKA